MITIDIKRIPMAQTMTRDGLSEDQFQESLKSVEGESFWRVFFKDSESDRQFVHESPFRIVDESPYDAKQALREACETAGKIMFDEFKRKLL